MARRDEPTPPERIRVVDVRYRLGIAEDLRIDDYGPTSALSEDLLLRGYGLRRPRFEGDES